MPERAAATVVARTGTGDIIPNATVTVRERGSTTAISETIYVNDDPDTSQYTNGAFYTGANGLITFYLTNQKRVDVLFEKAGYTSQTVPVDVQKSSLVSGYATIQDEGGALTQQAILNFTGAGVTATDDAANGRTNVAISVGETVATSTIWDAKGDLAVGTGADAAARLAVGADGSIPVADSAATTGLAWRAFSSASVATSESTTSTTYTDLATAGPAVTVTTGTRALVIVDARRYQSGVASSYAGFAVSGATTLAASDDNAGVSESSTVVQGSRVTLVTGLTPGSNTFTMKYRASANTGTFSSRRITVIPL